MFCQNALVDYDWRVVRFTCVFHRSLVILAAASALTFGVYTNFHDYWYNPILTSVKLVAESAAHFPDIYLCPTNYINRTFVLNNQVI